MIENGSILESLEITGKLMELHGENPFKSKAYLNAAFRLGKLRFDFNGKSKEDLLAVEGLGAGIVGKIVELKESGKLEDLERLLARTPSGVIEMLGVKGLGPKKVKQLWQELQIENMGELLYACNENRLITLKGFGEKTQLQVKHNVEFKLANLNKFHYASVEQAANELVGLIRRTDPHLLVDLTGQMARKCEVIDSVQVLIGGVVEPELSAIDTTVPVEYLFCPKEEFAYSHLKTSAVQQHLDQIGFHTLSKRSFVSAEEIYHELGLQPVPPEMREGFGEVELARKKRLPALIEFSDLRGALHNHSIYSDGVHSIKEMALHCRALGYEYFGICDHSKSAFYAQGLSVEKVIAQQEEVDALNSGESGFLILKGIESDILNDGSLDYPDEVLETFDFVVASVHSNLKMTESKATERLIKAVENPYTSILAHPTGRLLLARSGYPIDHRRVIDACAANGVHIELNANPYRLDIDWRWIPYCLEKGVMISINPDAHHKEAIYDMYYGTCIARKGGLSKEHCLNALPLKDLLKKL